MNFRPTAIPDVVVIEPRVFGDSRGFFFEAFKADCFAQAGLPTHWVQDNISRSQQNVLRGLHFQIEHGQAKLVRCLRGRIYDVAVDIRRSSPTFGQWVGCELSEENRHSLYIPVGFAHGFCVLSDIADVQYKCTDLYTPAAERTLMWNDSRVGIQWPVTGEPILSPKDLLGKSLSELECYP
ncbi:MAG: dTDP-4-dehydrorhamnose 3,5-epimerase [Planctomycetota bacterium]|nr:MAG: dTDP-4-dehydrorhamnose 3,5-epimerase [Planctomycetota bacterium]